MLRALLFAFAVAVATFPVNVAHAGEERFSRFCSATQSDDCIGVAKNGDVFSYWDRKVIGKAKILKSPQGAVARFGNSYFCPATDSRITRSYLICSKDGWSINGVGVNTGNPW